MQTITETLAASVGTVTVTRPVEVSRRARRRAPDHLQFIAEHWPSLAAAAYSGFRQHGAGVVVLFGEAEGESLMERLRPGRRAAPFRVHRLWYATTLQAVPTRVAQWRGAWEAEQLERYDPELEGVVLFVEGREVPCGYRAGGMLRPPAAHLRMQATLN